MYGSISVRAVRDKFETDGNQRPTKICNWVQLKCSWRRCRLGQILKISTEKPIIWVKMNLPSSFSYNFFCLFQIFYILTYFFSDLSLQYETDTTSRPTPRDVSWRPWRPFPYVHAQAWIDTAKLLFIFDKHLKCSRPRWDQNLKQNKKLLRINRAEKELIAL